MGGISQPREELSVTCTRVEYKLKDVGPSQRAFSDLKPLRHVKLLRDGVPGTPVHQDHRHDRDGHSEVTQGSPDAPANVEGGKNGETEGEDSRVEEVKDERSEGCEEVAWRETGCCGRS